MDKPFSYETFLRVLENDDIFAVDETSFYFTDDPQQTDRMLGCLREYETPYWLGYCDDPEGCCFETAQQMLEAKVFDGRSVKDRWEQVVFSVVGGISLDDWLETYKDKLSNKVSE